MSKKNGGSTNGRRRRKKKGPKVGKDTAIKLTNIQPRSDNQKSYLQSFIDYPITFGLGPAGTGKTFLACFAAAQLLAEGKFKRVVLVRPVVEAGESLGYLPGDIDEKLKPYIQPLEDALNDMIGLEKTKLWFKESIIQVIPLAYMRGRTLDNAFVILDEAQNTSIIQMKMFLTRMGNNSRFVVNGDITQTDLRDDRDSGLLDAYHRFKGVKGVNFVEFDQNDIVRHPVVQNIVNAYNREF